jgi:hypothetical protein
MHEQFKLVGKSWRERNNLASRSRSGLTPSLLIEPLGKFDEGNAQRIADVRHIEHIKAAVAQFVFAYEPLFSAKLAGQIRLQNTSLFAGLP